MAGRSLSVWRVSGRPDRTPYGWRGWAESDAVRRRFRGGSRLPVGRRWTAAAGVPLLLIGLLLGACGNSGRTVTVVSYNVQNL